MGLIDTDGLNFGTGLSWLTGGIGQGGLIITSSTSGAALFLAEWGPYGMAMDFTDASIAIDGSTGVLDYNSQGTVSSTGALLGPGSKLTYSAPSLKFTEQADGYIAGQAHNLILRSEDVSNASWTKTSTTTPSADTVSITNASAVHSVAQVLTSVAIPGATYEISVEMKAGTWRYVSLQPNDGVAHGIGRVFDLQTGTITASFSLGTLITVVGTPSITPVGEGWYRCVLAYTHGSSGTNISNPVLARVDGTNTAWSSSWTPPVGGETFQIRKYHLRRTPSVSTYVATTSAAVHDLPYVFSGGVRTGILVEPAATNVHVNSNDFSSAAWTKRGSVSVTKNQIGPDGVANSACRVTGLGAPGANDIYETLYGSVRWTASQTVTQSFYIKKVSASGTMQIVNGSSGTLYLSVNFALLGSGWERITPTHPAVTTGTLTAHAGGYYGPQFFASSGTLDFDIYCPQLEAGTVATSPIITYGSSVLRAADNISMATSLFPLSTTAETLYSGFTLLSTGTTDIAKLKPTSGIAEIFGFYFTPSSIIPIVRNGGSVSFAEGSFLSPVVGAHKYAMAAEVNNARGAVDGTLSIADTTSVTMPGTVNLLTLGSGNGSYGGSSPFLLSVLAYFPERKADATLQTMTTA